MGVVTQTLLVGLAGALGAVARYLLGSFVVERVRSRVPWGTLLINVSGAFIIGLLFAFTVRKWLSPAQQAILATGFLGGYTTFSTMSWEGFQLARGESRFSGIFYLLASIVLGLGAAALGIMVGGIA